MVYCKILIKAIITGLRCSCSISYGLKIFSESLKTFQNFETSRAEYPKNLAQSLQRLQRLHGLSMQQSQVRSGRLPLASRYLLLQSTSRPPRARRHIVGEGLGRSWRGLPECSHEVPKSPPTNRSWVVEWVYWAFSWAAPSAKVGIHSGQAISKLSWRLRRQGEQDSLPFRWRIPGWPSLSRPEHLHLGRNHLTLYELR